MPTWDVIFCFFLVQNIQYMSLYAFGGCTDSHPQWYFTAQDQAVFWIPWGPKNRYRVLKVCVRQEEVKLGKPHHAVTWVSFKPSPVLIKSKTVQHSINYSNHWFSLFPCLAVTRRHKTAPFQVIAKFYVPPLQRPQPDTLEMSNSPTPADPTPFCLIYQLHLKQRSIK